MIMKKAGRPGKKSAKLKLQFLTMLRSLLRKARRRPLHLWLLTDPESVPYLKPVLDKYIRLDAKHVGVEYSFFDLSVIAGRFRKEISELRPYFTSNAKAAKKYSDDLFMIAPFYHRVFPMRRLIMLDVDLKFRVDPAELADLFDAFSPHEVMGVASDLAPHYMHALRVYRSRNPGTHVGEPGRFQGFNTGVVLFDLDRMRRSELLNRLAMNVGGAAEALADEYFYRSHLGDQCFFTLVGMAYPELFHHLPCGYNYQLDVDMNQDPFVDVFWKYHNCTDEPKIYHGNGGAEIPKDDDVEAGHLGDPGT